MLARRVDVTAPLLTAFIDASLALQRHQWRDASGLGVGSHVRS
jgi:hypothetical protein